MKYHVFLLSVVLAVLLLAVLVILPVYAQALGRIEGHVTNLTTGGPPAEPLPSVEILVNEWMVLRSGRDGEWNITGLKPGVYAVRLNLPPGYSSAQEVITATIWGENIETVDLSFYEGEAPLSTVVTASTVLTNDRVTVLGQPGTATPTAVSTAVSTTITSTEAVTLPGRAGQARPVSTTLLWLVWGGAGVMITGLTTWRRLLKTGGN
jgi:hypothetical protein